MTTAASEASCCIAWVTVASRRSSQPKADATSSIMAVHLHTKSSPLHPRAHVSTKQKSAKIGGVKVPIPWMPDGSHHSHSQLPLKPSSTQRHATVSSNHHWPLVVESKSLFLTRPRPGVKAETLALIEVLRLYLSVVSVGRYLGVSSLDLRVVTHGSDPVVSSHESHAFSSLGISSTSKHNGVPHPNSRRDVA